MIYAIEVLQENDLWEEIESHQDYALVFKWFKEWQEDLPDKEIRFVRKEEIKIWDAVLI